MAFTTLVPSTRVNARPARSPFNLFDAFFNDSRLPAANSNGTSFSPRIDVSESETAYEISAELPGIVDKDIEITVVDGVLTLKGEKSSKQEEKEGNYYRQERAYGSFERSFHLPDEVEADKVEANFKNGVLTVGLPKSEEAQSVVHKVEVKTG